jgi:hypothetical protein
MRLASSPHKGAAASDRAGEGGPCGGGGGDLPCDCSSPLSDCAGRYIASRARNGNGMRWPLAMLPDWPHSSVQCSWGRPAAALGICKNHSNCILDLDRAKYSTAQLHFMETHLTCLPVLRGLNSCRFPYRHSCLASTELNILIHCSVY